MGALGSKTPAAKSGPHSTDKYTKRALLVGCNYPKTKAELLGCVNDVENWYGLLTEEYGFDKSNIKILVDEGSQYERPTGKNIKNELRRIVAESQPGDVVFFQFSGHGVQVPADADGDYEEDGLDEALAPTDLNLIVDDDLRSILIPLHDGVKFTMVSDCCHSGGMLDHEEIQISGVTERETTRRRGRTRGISVEDVMEDMKVIQGSQATKNRSLDVETMATMLKSQAKTNPKNVDKHIRSTLFEVYKEDASNAALAKRTRDVAEDVAANIHYAGPGAKPPTNLIDMNKGILITGCQSHETSADVTGADGRSFGALSHTIVRTIKRHREKFGNLPITNMELVVKVRQLLNRAGYEQNPCLECSEKNSKSNFIIW